MQSVPEPASKPKLPLGLTTAEARDRLDRYGANIIPEQHPHPVLSLLRRFWGPIPWMLEATIVIQLLLEKSGEAAVVAILLLGA